MGKPNFLTITAGIGEYKGEEVMIFNINKEEDGTPKVGFIPLQKLHELMQYAPLAEVKHYVDANKPELDEPEKTN